MDDLRLYLSSVYEYVDKDMHGAGFYLIYKRVDKDVTITIAAQYLNADIPKSVIVRAGYRDTVANVEINLQNYGGKVPSHFKFLIDDAVKHAKAQLMHLHTPKWASFWAMTAGGQAWWQERDTWRLNESRGGWSAYGSFNITGRSEKAPSFGYIGDWKTSRTYTGRGKCRQ